MRRGGGAVATMVATLAAGVLGGCGADAPAASADRVGPLPGSVNLGSILRDALPVDEREGFHVSAGTATEPVEGALVVRSVLESDVAVRPGSGDHLASIMARLVATLRQPGIDVTWPAGDQPGSLRYHDGRTGSTGWIDVTATPRDERTVRVVVIRTEVRSDEGR